MQNKHYFFFVNRISQKGGVGGDPAIWEKFPKNVVFFLDKPPKEVQKAATETAKKCGAWHLFGENVIL